MPSERHSLVEVVRERVTCSRCQVDKPLAVVVQGRPLCHNCRVTLQHHPARCPTCAVVRVLAFVDDEGHEVCADCAGERPTFCCSTCAREDNSYGARCAPCVLAERVTELLTDPATGQVHVQLVPLFVALVGAERPQSTIFWLQRTPGDGPRLLAAMARGETPISHETFERLPANKSYHYLRDLLAAVGVLPPYEARLARMSPWLDDLLLTLPSEHARVIEPFARWRVLRHLRRLAERDELTKGMVQNARWQIRGAATLLAWLSERELTITTATLFDLEHYFTRDRTRTRPNEIHQFLAWARETGLNPALEVPVAPEGSPTVTMSDADRWRHVELLLHDTTIRHYVRVGGLFMLLFAQPLTTICAMKTSQIKVDDDRLFVTFDRTPVEMPELLDDLIHEQMTHRGQASFASRNGQWLFPGGTPGKHLTTENIRRQLVERGIKPQASRHAALFQLAAEVPHVILADMLGISATTATRWAALSSRTWAQYSASRRENNRHDEE